jgi:hypothetical protein
MARAALAPHDHDDDGSAHAALSPGVFTRNGRRSSIMFICDFVIMECEQLAIS